MGVERDALPGRGAESVAQDAVVAGVDPREMRVSGFELVDLFRCGRDVVDEENAPVGGQDQLGAAWPALDARVVGFADTDS